MKLRTLQAGRGLAALAVLAFHLSIMMADPRFGGVAIFANFTFRGNLGVDFFFVLSGFIILHAHHSDLGQPGAWKRYVYRRFARVYPVYWLFLGLFVGLLALGLGAVATIPKDAAHWLSDIFLVRLSSSHPTLAPAWTLFHEIAFYSIFSFAILNRQLGVILLAGWAAACLLLFHYDGTAALTALNVYTSAFNLNFFLGMAAYWAWQRRIFGWSAIAAGAALLLVATLAITTPAISSLLSAVSFAALITGFVTLEERGRVRVPVLMGLIGDASYSIYLTHEHIASLGIKILLRLNLDHLLGRSFVYLAVLPAVVAAGVAVYFLVERPLTRRLRQWEPRRAPDTES